MTFSDLLLPLAALLGAGLLAGFAAGIFGIGGGFIVVPALFLVLPLLGGLHAQYAHVAIGTSAATIIITSIRSLRSHARRGAVEYDILWSWAPWIALGDGLGVILASHVDGAILTFVFATGVLLISLNFLLPRLGDRVIGEEMPTGLPRVAIAGGLGTFSALLGIGGGLAANPAAGLYYICTPNNPTGTITPLADIEWLIANKPAGSMVLLDEAYTHFAEVPVASSLAVAHRDVIVLRTFSKLFGMAGLRMGYIVTNPANIAKMMRYDGGMQSGALPVTSLACATASLTAAPLIAARRSEMQQARGLTLDHLRARGVSVKPTDANMFMIDWKTRRGADMQAAFRKQSVEIGRSWPIWPTVSRVTVGSMAEMKAFCVALDKVMA